MNPIVLDWPGGNHAFQLRLGELHQLQEKTDAGPEFLLRKLQAGQWSASELREILRLGLVGGGLDHASAVKAVDRALGNVPLMEFKVAALAVLIAALYGPPDDEVGKNSPVEPTPAESEKTDDGGSATLSATARPVVGRRKRSAK